MRREIDRAYEDWDIPFPWLERAKAYCKNVKITVTGGFTPRKIREFEENGVPADVYGVGSYLFSNSVGRRHQQRLHGGHRARQTRRRMARHGESGPPCGREPGPAAGGLGGDLTSGSDAAGALARPCPCTERAGYRQGSAHPSLSGGPLPATGDRSAVPSLRRGGLRSIALTSRPPVRLQ